MIRHGTGSAPSMAEATSGGAVEPDVERGTGGELRGAGTGPPAERAPGLPRPEVRIARKPQSRSGDLPVRGPGRLARSVVRRGAALASAVAVVAGLSAVALGAPRVTQAVHHAVRQAVSQAVNRVVHPAAKLTPSAPAPLAAAGSAPQGSPSPDPSPPPAPASPGPGDWPGYSGGTLANTFAVANSELTAATVGSLRLAWEAPADNEVSGNPIAVGNQVVFTTYSGTVYAVARDTGRTLWTTHLTSVPINGGALYDSGRLFVATSDGTVAGLDPASGRVIWTSPSLFGGLKDALRATPQAYDGVLYESLGGSGDDLHEQGGVVALDEQTGRVIWRTLLVQYDGGGAAVFSPPAILPQLGELVVGTGNPTPYPTDAAAPSAVPPGPDPNSDSLVALSLTDGHVIWASQTHPHDASDADFIAAPNVVQLADGRLAVGDGEKDGAYHMFDAASGQPLWSANLTAPSNDTLIVATAAVADGRIFVGTMDVPNAAAATDWPANYQAPGTGRLVALDAQTGSVLWTDALPSTIASAPLAGQGVLVAVEADGVLVAVDPATGGSLWQGQAPGQIWNAEAAPSLAGSMLLVPLAHPGSVAAYTLAPLRPAEAASAT